jgi:eukaryotic-like serine/threonine-protein kinase
MEAVHASEARGFGKYTLVAKLATGGMAEIFLARLHGDGGFEKLVCIKRILPHLAKDPQFVAMFLDEARVAARISHPNVCQVFELGEWHKQYYIAMEYLEGVPLGVFRKKDLYSVMPEARLVAGFGVQACEGLHHAHQLKRPDGELLGVVHRDISPQNLFATVDGVVKVLDFGIAKVQDASVRTSTGAVKGTYAYMAPEQLRNERIDRRVDVWALGVVLWETLAQTSLFKRDTEFLTFEAITRLPIPNICQIRPDVPPLFGDAISRALSRNPADRFPTARALGEAIAQGVGPMGGPLSPAQISDHVAESFISALAEQRDLLRVAREGGHFDLESSNPLVAHGRMATGPVSNLTAQVEEARAEVAQFVAAQQAVDSLLLSQAGTVATPVPSRRSQLSASVDPMVNDFSEPSPQRRSQPHLARDSAPLDVQRPSYPSAPSLPAAPARPSRLPWIIALFSLGVAVATGILLYLKLSEKPSTKADGVQESSVVMSQAMPSVEQAKPVVPAAGSAAENPVPPPSEADKPGAPSQAAVGTTEPVTTEPATPEPATTEPVKPEPVKPEPVKPDRKVTAKPGRDVKVGKDPKATAKTETKVESKTEAKIETNPDPKSDPKVESKAVTPPAGGPPGFITIDSTPVYAVIYIDNKKYGETPLVNLKLAPGKHQVRAVSPSGATKQLSITIESGKTAPVRKISW